MNNQFMIGNTDKFPNELQNKDGVTIIGWQPLESSYLLTILQACSEAKHKDGIVHIDAMILAEITKNFIESQITPLRNFISIGKGQNPGEVIYKDLRAI